MKKILLFVIENAFFWACSLGAGANRYVKRGVLNFPSRDFIVFSIFEFFWGGWLLRDCADVGEAYGKSINAGVLFRVRDCVDCQRAAWGLKILDVENALNI